MYPFRSSMCSVLRDNCTHNFPKYQEETSSLKKKLGLCTLYTLCMGTTRFRYKTKLKPYHQSPLRSSPKPPAVNKQIKHQGDESPDSYFHKASDVWHKYFSKLIYRLLPSSLNSFVFEHGPMKNSKLVTSPISTQGWISLNYEIDIARINICFVCDCFVLLQWDYGNYFSSQE